ncbi:lipoate--protein ligase [Alicyclobacillus ferrooxydans]|uniref:lipoate--protein ligase n=1 Tax=Alicyclobacillus ferrooxydans TaxID=471514 RepID=A0A0P9CNT9_9BACL|nr:lipoate--protein ligase [Alicyclobacillus ferrooxydans]KPV40783.1 lipoate--protein ligase [Alicyclobacillus ferrooxydans]
MLFIDNKGITDPTINLAIEEYALTNLDIEETYLLFYINKPSIIIGKNQNTFEEINHEYVRENDIHVVRRLSGGGAVYHDLGNLSFSFITKNDGDSFRNFRRFTEPVTRALHELGVDAVLTGRNDIQVGDRKISGNAQFATRGRMFSHGTLMFDVNMEAVVSALHVSADKIASKGIKSVRSRVANIKEFLQEDMTITEFRAKLLKAIFGGQQVPEYRLGDADWEEIRQLSDRRYRNWDWNYGKSPSFNVRKSKRFSIGSIDVRLHVTNGIIESCKIYGDFFGMGDLGDVESKIVGCRYRLEDIRDAVEPIDLNVYFGNITMDEFLTLFE